ncbi:hypothetical protein DWB85_01865 [Seongchinamella sediminis]|uniref:Uncharacterized protein n=1 Tax=Seongchinamella sediminis TaxID=2283635 RepID=A0A3L7E349_9GAMM|nr:hypothetical protein [Seongchinamella sediminis]RLQ23325.1 hypothetical protein DWB85_01865 [Seongchinamella sediminis]
MNKSLFTATLAGIALAAVHSVYAEQPMGIQGNVTVINETSDPVPVTVTNQEPKADFQRVRILLGETRNCENVPCNATFGTSVYRVPEGKTLLIDEVSVKESFTGLGGVALLSVTGLGEQIQVPVIGEMVVAGGDSFTARSMNMHSTGLVEANVSFDQTPTGIVFIQVVIFGRLIDGIDTFIDCDPDSCL